MKSPTELNFSDNPLFEESKPQRKSFPGVFKNTNPEEGRIEKYLKLFEYEIKKHNFNIDQRCFIENIIKLLDNLSQVNKTK